MIAAAEISKVFKDPMPWWDDAIRLCACPVNYRRDPADWQKLIDDLAALGFTPIGEVQMPVDLGYRILVAEVPAAFDVTQDEESPEFFYFTDSKGRLRVRASAGPPMATTTVFYRYWPDDELKNGRLVECVRDLDAADHHSDEEPPIIWRGSHRQKLFPHRFEGSAAKWLDEHHPDWENPAAYWTP